MERVDLIKSLTKLLVILEGSTVEKNPHSEAFIFRDRTGDTWRGLCTLTIFHYKFSCSEHGRIMDAITKDLGKADTGDYFWPNDNENILKYRIDYVKDFIDRLKQKKKMNKANKERLKIEGIRVLVLVLICAGMVYSVKQYKKDVREMTLSERTIIFEGDTIKIDNFGNVIGINHGSKRN